MALITQTAVVNLTLLVLMKLINQLFTFNYVLFNYNIYETVNGVCRYKSPSEVDNATTDHVMRLLFSYCYCLAGIGGLLSSACGSRRLVLTAGGAVMTAASAGVSVVRVLDLACNRAAYILAWVLYPVAMFLVLACLLVAFADYGNAGRQPRERVAALVLYYVTASTTIWFNLGVWPLVDQGRDRGSHQMLSFAVAVFCLGFVVAAHFLQDPPPGLVTRLELPTKRRLLRYCLILSAFMLYIAQLGDEHIVMYYKEALFYMDKNSTDRTGRAIVAAFNAWNVPRTLNIGGMLASSAVLAGLSVGCSRRFPVASVDSRLFAGIGISASAAAGALVCSLTMRHVGSSSVPPLAAAAAFSALAIAEGVSEILTMVAAYEFLDEIAPTGHRDLLFGIALSVWNTATFLRCGIYNYAMPLLLGPDAVIYADFCVTQFVDHHTGYCATHVADLVLCAVCLAYTRFVSLPLAATLRLAAPNTDPAFSDEETPLLTNSSAAL